MRLALCIVSMLLAMAIVALAALFVDYINLKLENENLKDRLDRYADD